MSPSHRVEQQTKVWCFRDSAWHDGQDLEIRKNVSGISFVFDMGRRKGQTTVSCVRVAPGGRGSSVVVVAAGEEARNPWLCWAWA